MAIIEEVLKNISIQIQRDLKYTARPRSDRLFTILRQPEMPPCDFAMADGNGSGWQTIATGLQYGKFKLRRLD
jgi:hypothetical protein